MATREADGETRKAIVARIAGTPALRQQAMELAEPLRAAAWAKATDPELYAAIQPMMLVFRLPAFEDDDPRVSERLKSAWLKVVYDQLRDLPAEAVRCGVNELLKTHKFPDFPLPADIRGKSEPFAWQMRTAASRLSMALKAEPAPKVDAAEHAKIRDMMAREGWLDANGKFDPKRALAKNGARAAHPHRKPTESPAQMARRIRGGE